MSVAELLVVLACFLVLGQSATAKTTMNDFFPEIFEHGNLSEITWDHAVNSRYALREALANGKHMIEADVILGALITRNDGTQRIDNKEDVKVSVIMGHPPAIFSDLGLKDFLATIVEYNAAPGAPKKGIKLDFKSSDAYVRALSSNILLNEEENALKEIYSTFPIWINGDIAVGPGNPMSVTVDLKLDEMKTKPEILNAAIWSLGWTTGNYQEGAKYSTEQITAMKSVVNGIANVTFPVRAMYAAKSPNEMVSLLKVGTLTIWSAAQDEKHVDVVELAKLIKANLNKTYVDVPDTLWQKIVEAMSHL